MKFKIINPQLKEDIENEVLMMLASHRDTIWHKWNYNNELPFDLRNKRGVYDPNTYRLDANDGYYGEAFGIMRGLALLNYGYIGSDTQDAVREGKGTVPEQNFKWWLHELVDRILKETNYPNSTAEGTHEVLVKYRQLTQLVRMEKKTGVRK